jgi:hypothetical protein
MMNESLVPASLYFTSRDGDAIQVTGSKMAKKRNPVYLLQKTEAFQVETKEGVLAGNPGDYVAFDPLTGHVWAVSAEYVAMHYEPF